MLIACVIYSSRSGGPGTRVKNLLKGMNKYTKHEIILITGREETWTNEKIKIYRFLDKNPLKMIYMWGKLKEILKDVDLVHVTANVYTASFAKACYKGPFVIGPNIQIENLFHRELIRKYIRPDYFIANTPLHLDWLRRNKITNLNSIYGCTDTELFRPLPDKEINEIKKKENIAPNKKVILYVGELIEFKGIHIAYEAYQLLRKERSDILFLVIGDGPLKSTLKEDLLYLGFKENEQLYKYYNIADICVMPSISEVFSNVWLESMASGTPVITTARGIAKDLFEEHEIGIWTERNPESIKEAISMMLEDRSIYEKYRNNGLSYVQSNHNLKVFAERHVAIYEEALKKHPQKI